MPIMTPFDALRLSSKESILQARALSDWPKGALTPEALAACYAPIPPAMLTYDFDPIVKSDLGTVYLRAEVVFTSSLPPGQTCDIIGFVLQTNEDPPLNVDVVQLLSTFRLTEKTPELSIPFEVVCLQTA